MSAEKTPLLLETTYVYGSGDSPTPSLHLKRPIYHQEELNQVTCYQKPRSGLYHHGKRLVSGFKLKRFLHKGIPIADWLPRYKWRRHLVADMVAGFTVAVMHIPQGMAYAILGKVPPVIGIYTAFFPVLIYAMFGSSRHVSMGTFAIVCLMVGKVVETHQAEFGAVEVATGVTLAVGALQLAMYALRLGILSQLLSNTLVNAFTTAAALHVVATQLKDLLGLAYVSERGAFKLYYCLRDVVQHIGETNLAAIGISVACIAVMMLNNEVLKPRLAARCRLPVPIELAAVACGTAASYLLDLEGACGLQLVGPIPTGLPAPAVPRWELVQRVAGDSVMITLVSYAVTMSMGLIFAQMGAYEVSANQELLAMGLSNSFGAFFSCLPVTASLSRSMLQQAVGGRTQLASIISCCLLLVVMLWIGPAFEYLPRCVLASIIVVALKSMLVQVSSVVHFYRLSRLDALVWVVTFCTVLLLDIDVGLLAGLGVSLASLLVAGCRAYACTLGVVPDTDLYLDHSRYPGTRQLPHMKMFHYCGGLHFASTGTFRAELFRSVGFRPSWGHRRHLQHRQEEEEAEAALKVRCIIVDLSALSYLDPSGAKQLTDLVQLFRRIDVELYAAGLSGPKLEMMHKHLKYSMEAMDMFPTVHDAVLYAQAHLLKMPLM